MLDPFDAEEYLLRGTFEEFAQLVLAGLGEPNPEVKVQDVAADLLALGMCIGRRIELLGVNDARGWLLNQMAAL